MKKIGIRTLLPWCVALLGGLGYGLRTYLYGVGLDEKNLLVSGHPLELALWAVTAVAAGLIFSSALHHKKEADFGSCFSASFTASLGHIGAAAGILLTVLPRSSFLSPLMQVWRLLGLISAPLLLAAAFYRTVGKRPFFGIYGVCCMFFALHLVAHYQSWCSDPQLQNYVFAFLGVLLLMLFSYHQTAFCIDRGNPRLQRMAGLLALYCCLVTASGGEYLMLYLGCGLWAGTGLCDADTHPTKKAGEDHVPS